MSTNRRINIADLEFDQIKINLKTFLQGQDLFSDYDFDGSNMSVLLDLLAYNTHYNAMYTNMALNEVYLDSASRRDSVVSLAKSLGYLPRSAVGAKTKVNFALTGVSSPTSVYQEFVTIPYGTKFSGIKDGNTYSFLVREDVTAQRNATTGNYNYNNVVLIEGTIATSTFEYSALNAFTIPNINVDIETLVVRIQSGPTNTSFETYRFASEFANVDGDSLVYFLKETDDGSYQLSFGDGIIGKQLSSGNIINIEYIVCNGSFPNGINSLYYDGNQITIGSITGLTMLESVNGGRDQESIDEIRFNAPNFYATQNRAVTALDYESIILSKVPAISAVSVWGGENNNPPVYGKVFISANTVSGRDLTYSEQQTIITNVIDQYKVVSVIPEFVVPEYIDIELDVVAYYDTTLTTNTAETIKSIIIDNLLSYNNSELKQFNKIMRQSTVSRIVEGSERSVISCMPRVKIYRTITPAYSKSYTYNVFVGNPFATGTIKSSGFYINNYPNVCYIEDDGNGLLNLVATINGIKTFLKIVGTVDYTTGYVKIENLNIVRLAEGSFYISVTPSSSDVASNYNQIVALDTTKLKINVIADETTKGRVFSGNKFTFTPNRI